MPAAKRLPPPATSPPEASKNLPSPQPAQPEVLRRSEFVAGHSKKAFSDQHSAVSQKPFAGPVQMLSLLYSRLLPFSLFPRVSPLARASLILIRIHATARTPDRVKGGLIGAVHSAKAEVHDPRDGRIACVRRRRPIIADPTDSQKRMARGQGRKRVRGVHQARQLVDGRQSPTFAVAGRAAGALRPRRRP